MDDVSIASVYSLISRDPMWSCVENTKDFDDKRTSVRRVFQHDSGLVVAYSAETANGSTTLAMEAGPGAAERL